MGFDINKLDVQKSVQHKKWMGGVIKRVARDPEAMDDLAKQVGDKLGDVLEEDPNFKKKIIDAALASPEFKKRIVVKLIKELD